MKENRILEEKGLLATTHKGDIRMKKGLIRDNHVSRDNPGRKNLFKKGWMVVSLRAVQGLGLWIGVLWQGQREARQTKVIVKGR